MSEKYTLKDAAETFCNNQDLVEFVAIRRGRDISGKVISIDMGDGDKFDMYFEDYITWIRKLDFYEINVLDENDLCGFEFTLDKHEYYKFLFKKE